MATGTQALTDQQIIIDGLCFWYFLTSSAQNSTNPPDFRRWPSLPAGLAKFFSDATTAGNPMRLLEALSAPKGPWNVFNKWPIDPEGTLPSLDANTLARIWLLLVTRPDLRADSAALTSIIGQLTSSPVTGDQVKKTLLLPTAGFDTTVSKFGTFSTRMSIPWQGGGSHPRASELNQANPVDNALIVRGA